MSTTSYSIDPAHSTVRFWVRHLGIAKVHGTFTGVSGTVELDPTNPGTASVDASIDVNTISTGQEGRDGHLKSADFFDVEKYPTMTFKSKSTAKEGEGEYKLTGDFTLHGVTKEITLEVEVTPEVASPFGGLKVGASASTVINRDDFGLTWNQLMETGGVMVGKEIHITLDIELDRPA